MLADPRRGTAIAYADDKCRDNLAALVVFDNEMWTIHSRAKEAVMAQFRLRFWLDKAREGEGLNVFDDISAALKTLLQSKLVTPSDIEQYLYKHVEYVEYGGSKGARKAIWNSFFILSLKLTQSDELLASMASTIISNAINDEYVANKYEFKKLNKDIARLDSKKRNGALDSLLFLCLAHSKKCFEDIIQDDNKNRKLGLSAVLTLFIHRLFGRI